MFKKINRLIWLPLKWSALRNTNRDFVTDKYPIDICYLRMNDFPDKPLWTLFYKGDSIDFDDTPILWDIIYRNEKQKGNSHEHTHH